MITKITDEVYLDIEKVKGLYMETKDIWMVILDCGKKWVICDKTAKKLKEILDERIKEREERLKAMQEAKEEFKKAIEEFVNEEDKRTMQ